MRNVISLNENWTLTFPKGERPAEAVTLPHTWNAVDGMDGNGSYLRTTGVYTRTFTAPKQPLAGGAPILKFWPQPFPLPSRSTERLPPPTRAVTPFSALM